MCGSRPHYANMQGLCQQAVVITQALWLSNVPVTLGGRSGSPFVAGRGLELEIGQKGSTMVVGRPGRALELSSLIRE